MNMLANISSELSTIQNGIYGEDIRTAIKEAIRKVNDAGYMPVVENLNVNANGTYTPSAGVNGFSKVVVNVPTSGGGGGYPEPTGTIQITANGTVNVKDYASANVNVPNSYDAADDGKVVSSGALVSQTSRSVTANGTYDTTENDEVVVNVSGGTINLQSKTATQNGTVTPDEGYDGLSSVVVDVQGGGGSGNVSYGTDDPAASAGSDGDVYFKYEHYSVYDSLLPDGGYDLDNWEKNSAAFPQFYNTYLLGENTLVHTGGNGYERIFVPVSVVANTDYTFDMKYYSPSGVAGGYSGQLGFGVSFASESTMKGSGSIGLDYKTNLSLTAESDYSDYSLSFNSGNNTSAYLVIDLNIYDGNQCTLKFKDIVFYKANEPPVYVDGNVIRSVYIKQDGVWVNAIGAVIDTSGGGGGGETVDQFVLYKAPNFNTRISIPAGQRNQVVYFSFDGIVFYYTSTADTGFAVITENKIDVTDYDTLYIKGLINSIVATTGQYVVRLGIANSIGGYEPSYAQSVILTTASAAEQTIEVDISGYSGEYYVALSGWGLDAEIHEIGLKTNT